MKWLNGYRMRLVLVGFVAVIVFGGGRLKADFIFGEPTNLGPTVNSSAFDSGPCISDNGLRLFYHSDRPGGYGGKDLWVTMRGTNEDLWAKPVNLGPNVNGPADDMGPSISADGLFLFFHSHRTGGLGANDIWVTRRATAENDWSTPVNLGPAINSSYAEGGPEISSNGLTLYFNSNRPGGYGNHDLWVTTRENIDGPWSEPMNLGPTVNSSANERGPCILVDDLSLLFRSNRAGGYGYDDSYITRRASLSDSWGTPVNLGPKVNTSATDTISDMSADGSIIYLRTNRSGGYGDMDIWQVSIEPVVDLNGDGIVDSADMCIMVDYWGTDESLCDIGPMPWGDGIVDVEDLKVLAEYFFGDMRCVAHFKLDETKGSLANDSTRNRDGTVHGGPEWRPIDGVVGGALQLDGVDDYVRTGFVLNPADGALSVFAWVKGGAPGQVVVAQKDGANWLCVNSLEGNLMTELKGPGRSGDPLLSQTGITDGEWHRIGFVWDGSNRTLYVDGVAVAQDTQDGLEGLNSGLYIGCGKAMEVGTYWSGLIDDVRIYDAALSVEEVEALAR